MPQGYKRAASYLRAGLVTGSLVVTSLAATAVVEVHPAGATVTVSGRTMISTLDTPDPDVVYSGSGDKYYAYATGTNTVVLPTGAVWSTSVPANWTKGGIGLTPLACTASGCAVTGVAHVAMSPTSIPSSLTIKYGLQAPSVGYLGGRWVMYYAGLYVPSGRADAVYDSTSSSPTTGFSSPSSEGPLMYQASAGGSTDPSVFIDNSGNPWLQWKSSTYATDGVLANLWSMPLTSTGLGMTGTSNILLTQPTRTGAWDRATIENPDMIYSGGTYYLFYSGGHWTKATYAEGYVTCSGPTGGCGTALSSHEILSGTTSAPYGPGGASLFTATTGTWLMAYHGWNLSCTTYAYIFGDTCGASRQLYVNQVGGLSPTTPSINLFTASASTVSSAGGTVTLTAYATRAVTYTFTTSSGLTLSLTTVHGTTGSAGTTVNIPPNTAGTFTFTVTATGPYGGQATRSVSVVEAPATVGVAVNGPTHSLDIHSVPIGSSSWTSTVVAGSGTTYSAPSMILDTPNTPNSEVIAAEGATNSLVFYYRTTSWHPEQVAGAGTTYSAPSMVMETSNVIIISAEGPSNSLRFYFIKIGTSTWAAEQVAGAGTTYSAPSMGMDRTAIHIAMEGPTRSLTFAFDWIGSATWGREQAAAKYSMTLASTSIPSMVLE